MADNSLNPLSVLNCALSSNENEHLCEKPVILSCGHYICNSCIPIGNQNVKCSICNMINNGVLNKDIEHQAFNFILNLNLNQLFAVSFEKLDNIIKTFNEIVNNNDERIDNHVQFIQDEIQIQIESVKIRLDNIYESFVKQLQDIKIKWKLDNKNIKMDDFDINKNQNELKELENNIKNKQNLTKDNLYHYQQQIRTIQKTINEFNSRSPKLTFLPNESKIDEDFVGKLKYEVYDFDVRIKQKIKANDFGSFNVRCSVSDISELPNGNALFTNCRGSNILIYNKNKELIRTVTKINNKAIAIIGVATDGIDKIYFSDHGNHLIIKTDLELNHLITFGNGRGAATNQVNYPVGISFFNEFLYVCDRINNRIVKLDSNLVYQALFQLNYVPFHIKIMNNIAMIRAQNESSIYFHDLNNFTVRKKYRGHNGIIGVSKEYFYEFYSNNKVFYCYDKNGEMVEEIQTNGLNVSNYGFWGTISTYNSNLFLCQDDSTSISIISSI